MGRRKNQPDRLTRWAMEATAAGMSYGRYVAENHPTLTSGGEDLQPEEKTKKQQESERKRTAHQHYMVPVIGTDMETGREKRYDCIADVRKDGFSSASVSNCINGRMNHTGGCTWRRATATDQKLTEPIIGYNEENGDTVYYNSLADAREAGLDGRKIRRCIQGHQKSYRGYCWRIDEDE